MEKVVYKTVPEEEFDLQLAKFEINHTHESGVYPEVKVYSVRSLEPPYEVRPVACTVRDVHGKVFRIVDNSKH
ncbi:hypothetical protein [Rufibacter sp. XAAS-G3-1]|uniref:hypothetical protein n=1 Tax=Rufibacter sp. XAAS-G3-1 TaxID=2729134 RepID=UPI0015E7DF50|nr:hypothetical protein [Rufibacter sp. XAAS-G3-1]